LCKATAEEVNERSELTVPALGKANGLGRRSSEMRTAVPALGKATAEEVNERSELTVPVLGKANGLGRRSSETRTAVPGFG
jgi:hypothetical protein